MTTDERTVRELFAALDAGDAPHALQLLTEDARFQLGNAPATVGHKGFALTRTHGLESAPARARSDLGDGGDLSAPRRCAADAPLPERLSPRADRIADYRIYMDINPVFAPATTTGG